MDSGRAVVIGIGALALGAAILSATAIYSVAVTADGSVLSEPPRRVTAAERRESDNRRSLKRCVYDMGGRAMFDSRGDFQGCDRAPSRRVIRQAERSDGSER
jgi:hypothetical protein